MTDRDLIIRMAGVIKRTIDTADRSNNALLGIIDMSASELCILPFHLRRDLGDCLDKLSRLESELINGNQSGGHTT